MPREVNHKNNSLSQIKLEIPTRTAKGEGAEALREFETIIVGAGQAGLSVGRYLKELGREFIILDENDSIGASWRQRYDSLTLDSFAKYTALAGFAFPGDPLHQPTKDETAEYLASAARKFNLYPRFSTKVLRIGKGGDMFIVTTNAGNYYSRFVVLATGPFHTPVIPELSRDIPPDIRHIHSKFYKNPSKLESGETLVVGGGNSGGEIALEIALSGREVFFSSRKKFRSIRSSPFSQWLAYAVGLAHVPVRTLLGRLIIWYTRGKAVGIDVKSLLRHPKIASVGALVGVKDGMIMSERGPLPKISNIIWATGYASDFSIVAIPGFDPETQKRGVTNVPGLFLLNMRWQYSKSSSHLAGISRDARYIAEKINEVSSHPV